VSELTDGRYIELNVYDDQEKANQVFKLGSGEAFTVAPGYHTVEVPDVINGHRYRKPGC
jgi:hypothetical protein